MIPELIIDQENVKKFWPDPDKRKEALEIIGNSCVLKGTDFPVHCFDELWVESDVFTNFKKFVDRLEFFQYGYGDTEESIAKYLQKYADDKENNYFVAITLMNMNYEKYYKNGSYINKDGVDTHDDYYPYIKSHPEMKVKQDFKNKWICFSIRKLA